MQWYIFILGKIPTVEEPTSCQDLKMSGFLRSTYYMMKNSEGNVKLSFCNMESHSGYDNTEMEQPIGYLMIESNTTKAKFKQLEEEFQRNKRDLDSKDAALQLAIVST